MSSNDRTQGFLTAVTGNWASRIYLAVAFALLIWAVADLTLVTHEDASFAAVVPFLVTAPTSMVALLVPDGAAWAFFLVIAVAAVVNAALIGRLAAFLRR